MSRGGLIRMKGAAVTFTHNVAGSRNRTAGTFGAPVPVSVPGYALRAVGDAQTYRALELKETEAITLDFEPTTAGQFPEEDYAFTWGGSPYKVVTVEKIDQAGTVKGARIVGVR